MNQLSLLESRANGATAAQACHDKVARAGFDASGAAKFIVSWLVRHGPSSGEDLVDAAMGHGFRGLDQRCFGGVFRGLIAQYKVRIVRSDLPRKRGNGTSGGKLYAAVL